MVLARGPGLAETVGSVSGRWAPEPERLGSTAGSRLVDTALFACLPFSGVSAAGLPLSEVAMLLAVVRGLCRRPTRIGALPRWVVPLAVAIPAWMSLVALMTGVHDLRRIVHLVDYASLVVLLGEGRFDLRAVARGLAGGLVVAVGAGFTGVGGGYTGRLSGFVGDPNAAGYALTVLGCVAMAHLDRGRPRLLFGIAAAALICLTLSRTSLIAALLALTWMVVPRSLRGASGLALLGAAIYGVGRIPEHLKVFGPFSGRSGSDALRQRILTVEHRQIDASPWIGNGPGTSRVLVDNNWFFFHNSYLAARNEAGWIGLGVILLLGVRALVGLARRPSGTRWPEAALVAVAVCALSLGEVLLELPSAIALGVAACHLTRPETEPGVGDP